MFGRVLVVAACVLGGLIAGPARAAEPVGTITTYSDPSINLPSGIAAGPDGALWFTNNLNNSIGRISTSGAITNYTNSGIYRPNGIASGPDGALWFTNDTITNVPGGYLPTGSIGRITTSGAVTIYTDPSIRLPTDIVAGPDGALWFTNPDPTGRAGGSIERITTTGTVTDYTDSSIDGPEGITVGPDGALWFTNYYSNSIGRITTTGTVTNYTDPSINGPHAITAGPDGALWFTNDGIAAPSSIGRITTSGTVTNYTDPSIDGALSITTGPDGALWFDNGVSIGRITTSGVVSSYTDPAIRPFELAAGPDGAVWFTSLDGSDGSIGRIQAVAQAQTITFPAISGIAYGHSSFNPGATASSGLAVSYTSQTTNVCTIVNDQLDIVAAGDCTVTAAQSGDQTYAAATPVSQTFTIATAPLTLTASSTSTPYGGPIPAVTGAYTGWVNGDTTAVLTGALRCTTTATAASAPGSYPTSCGGQSAANYTIAMVSGTLTVTRKAATLAYTGQTKSSLLVDGKLSLQVTITPAPGGTPDLTKAAPLTFNIYKPGKTSGAPSVTCTAHAVSAAGVATCNTKLRLGTWYVIVEPPTSGYFSSSASPAAKVTVSLL